MYFVCLSMSAAMLLEGRNQYKKHFACRTLLVSLEVSRNTAKF